MPSDTVLERRSENNISLNKIPLKVTASGQVISEENVQGRRSEKNGQLGTIPLDVTVVECLPLRQTVFLERCSANNGSLPMIPLELIWSSDFHYAK